MPEESADYKFYEAAAQQARYEGTVLWQRFGAFLLPQTIFLAFVLQAQSRLEVPTYNLAVFLAGVVGLVLCVPWLAVYVRSSAYEKLRIEQARQAEPAGWNLLAGDGERFSRGECIEVPEKHRMPWLARILRTARAGKFLIGVFGFIYLALATVAGPWWPERGTTGALAGRASSGRADGSGVAGGVKVFTDGSGAGESQLSESAGSSAAAQTIRGIVGIDPTSVKFGTVLPLVISIAVLGAGLGLIVFSSRTSMRVLGGVATGLTALGTAHFGGTLIREAKIGTLLKIENKFEQPSSGRGPSTAREQPQVPRLEGVGAIALGRVEGFPVGESSIDTPVGSAQIARIKTQWDSHAKPGKDGVILLVGSADRQPLGDRLRRRFDSNAGLARARADWVKRELMRLFQTNAVTPKFITLVSGPAHTGNAESQKDLEGDRSVEVWVIWTAAS